MTARGRVSSSTDWDPMRDDFNDSTYDVQYQDNDTSGRSMQSAPLDHKKLYITNVPPGLNEQGLRTAFEKYGQVEQAFLSRDPSKKFGLIRYETAAEARIAMMKLNRTEPLNLHINLAHAKANDGQNKDRGHKDTKDSGSFVSNNRERKPRNQEESLDDEAEQIEDSMGIDHNFHLEMEKIKLDKLRIQEEQLKCRQKMMLLQLQKRPNVNQAPVVVSSSRRLLPDGKVIVQERIQEPDANFTAGAGDSLNIPGLQRVSEKTCIVCGARADLFCARCAVTPYCSEPCQRKDWHRRHSAVCHNLMRLHSSRNAPSSSPVETVDPYSCDVTIPAPPAPLRRPRSPVTNRGTTQRNNQVSNGNKDFKGFGEKASDRGQPTHFPNNNKTRFVPPGHRPSPQRASRDPPSPQNQRQNDEDEDWGPTDKMASELKKSPKTHPGVTNIKNQPRKPSLEVPKFEKAKPKIKAPAPKVETPTPKAETNPNTRVVPNVVSETRTGTKTISSPAVLVPSQFLVEKLPIGDSFVLSVEQAARSCASKQAGFVCLAMHADYQVQFNDLLSDIYQGDAAVVPKPGSTFAYFEPSDEGWYRARCLNATKCALLDGSRVADISAQSQCRALAPKYADIPEFCCVLDGQAEIGMSLKCTILMKTAEGYKVSIDSATEDSYLGEGVVNRWIPEVELPAPAKQPQVQSRLREYKNEPTPTPEVIPQSIPDVKPQAIPKVTPQAVPDVKPQAIPKVTPQAVPDVKPQAIPKVTPQAVPDVKPQTIPDVKPQVTKSSVPDIARPDIVDNGKYVLLHVTSLARACVRACDDDTTAEFETVLQDAALYGIQSSKRLASPPSPGEMVLCHYEGVHYRALVTRTKAVENRYKVQYAEYGNEEIVSLEKLYVCPPELSLKSRPTRASFVTLSTTDCKLTPAATDYIDSLKEEIELIANISTGEKTVPSGSLVQLSTVNGKENVNKKLKLMCKPEWKKLEESGGDVIESDVILISSLSSVQLPTSGDFVLEVTDFSYLERGMVCGFEHGIDLPRYIYGSLTDKINEYCNSALCSEPYLPMVEELCLAKLEPYPQWFRAVVVSHRPGASTATVLYVDYGNMSETVPVSDLRKCMPEFAKDPALAASADIKDWPKAVTPEQLLRAIEFLQIDEEGRGRLPVKSCRWIEDDMTYIIEAPELIAAISK